jgi:hypothetical protein
MEQIKEDTSLMTTEEQIHALSQEVTPVTVMENSLSAFMGDVFDQVRKEEDYQQKIKSQIIKNLPTMKNQELIALMTSASTNKNDLISKVISPTMGLMTAAQQNEMAERKEMIKNKEEKIIGHGNMSQMNAMAPSEVLAGLQALFNMANAVQVNPVSVSVSDSQDTAVEKKD